MLYVPWINCEYFAMAACEKPERRMFPGNFSLVIIEFLEVDKQVKSVPFTGGYRGLLMALLANILSTRYKKQLMKRASRAAAMEAKMIKRTFTSIFLGKLRRVVI